MISFFFDTSIYSYQKTSSSVRKNSDFWTALNRLVTLDATVFRSSHSLMFYKKGVRKAFANIQKKNSCVGVSFQIKLQASSLEIY